MIDYSFDKMFKELDNALTTGQLNFENLLNHANKELKKVNKFSDVILDGYYSNREDETIFELKIKYSHEKVKRFEALKRKKENIEEQLKEFEDKESV